MALAVLLASISAAANDAGSARGELEKFAGKLKNFQADFTQTVKSHD